MGGIDFSGKPTKVSCNRILLTDDQKRIAELEAENARLRQQRDAANAQLDFIMENTKCDTVSGQNVSSQD